MNAIFHKKFQKFVKKLKDKKLISEIKKEVDLIIQDNSKGKLLVRPFRKHKIQSCRFRHKKNSYRIAYIVSYSENEIAFLLIGSRESFYGEMKKT